MSLHATIDLTHEVTRVLTDIERAGIQIDEDALQNINKEFETELRVITKELEEIVKRVMGDTPINLASSKDRSRVIYSRDLIERKVWMELHNIGTNKKTGKALKQTQYNKKKFKELVNKHTRPIARTVIEQCPVCRGIGKYAKKLKSGEMGKPRFNCRFCDAKGVIYTPTKKLAGFGVMPRGYRYASANGFNTDKETLEELSYVLTGDAKEFVIKLTRFNALNTYLGTFVAGIEKGLGKDGRIHPSFNQCVTYTGRLSSSGPNFQNMPRGTTFPVKRAIISRFEGGSILEGDFSQLEFRVAVYLANDMVGREDVNNEVDVHRYTADIIFGPTTDLKEAKKRRQEAKAHTFKPLYGGMSGTREQKAYYDAFKEKYSGIALWHEQLQSQALNRGIIVLPSGREFNFADVRRTPWGGVTRITALKNYPVQSYATADLLPISLVRCHRELKQRNLNTVICNTVHDSIILDVFPGEEDMARQILIDAMTCLPEETERRYGKRYDMPVGVEIQIGPNWLEMEEVYADNG